MHKNPFLLKIRIRTVDKMTKPAQLGFSQLGKAVLDTHDKNCTTGR